MKHFVFQLRNLPWKILGYFFPGGEKSTALMACLLSYFEIISNVEQSCMKSTAYTRHPDHTTLVLSLFFLKHLRTGCRDQSPWAPEDKHERTRMLSYAFLYTIAVWLSNSKNLTDSHGLHKSRTRLSTVAPIMSSTENSSLHPASNPNQALHSHVTSLVSFSLKQLLSFLTFFKK